MIISTLFLGSCASNSSTTEGKNAKVEEVISTLDNVNEINFKSKKNVLLDVRTPKKFKEGHVPGAINIDVKNNNFTDEISK